MSMIPLTTPAFVRSTFLKQKGTDTSDDTFLTALIAGLSGLGDVTQLVGFEAYCCRVFPRAVYTEYFDSDGIRTLLPVLAYPIVAAEVWVDANQVWGEDTKVDTAALLVDRGGLPFLRSRFALLSPGRQHIKVTYTGGLHETTSDVPVDLALACAMQAAFLYQTRGKLGVTSESVPGGSVTMFAPQSYLPAVKERLQPFVRML